MDMKEYTAQVMTVMNEVLGGTRDFKPHPPLTQEERAQREVDLYNSEVGNLNEQDGYDCPLCRNTGFVYRVYNARPGMFYCSCRKARESIRRMRQSGLKGVISQYTFANYETAEAWQAKILNAAKGFVRESEPRWFFIGGASGSGKTHICTAICREFLASAGVRYMLWEDESVQLKSKITEGAAYENHMRELKEADVLYIDDFFGSRSQRGGVWRMPSEADIRLARELLNHRYVNRQKVIISSEWYSDEILKVDTALGGRIAEMCGPYCMNINRDSGKNVRLDKAEKRMRELAISN